MMTCAIHCHIAQVRQYVFNFSTSCLSLDCVCAIFNVTRSYKMDPDLKRKIINEAYRLFIAKGIRNTSFCDVALAVHKSKGAVIHHFPSKNNW